MKGPLPLLPTVRAGRSTVMLGKIEDGKPNGRLPQETVMKGKKLPTPPAPPAPKVKGAISFSLFGSSPVYCQGAVRNAELAKNIYPGWAVVIYCAKNVPSAIKSKLQQLGVDVREPVQGIENRMFDRFCVIDDPQFDFVVVRDCDSRLSLREKRAVDMWLASTHQFHSMADHPAHTLPLGGGLFGVKKGAVLGVIEAIKCSGLASKPYTRETGYGLDQTFLTKFLWPTARKSVLRHDSCNRQLYPYGVPFPDGCKFGADRFVGEIFNERDEPHSTHWQWRCNYMTT